MNNEKKIALLEDMFEMEAGELSPEMVLDEIEEWDSMAALSLIVLMSDEFGKKLTSEQIKQFRTIHDIMDYMG